MSLISLYRQLRQQDGGRQILFNTGWLFYDKIIRLGVGLFITVWIARYLGPDQFGLLNYAAALVALFSVVAGLGLDTIVIRDLVRSPEKRDQILGTAFFLRLLAGVLAVAGTLVAVGFLRHGEDKVLWLVTVTSAGVVVQSFDVIEYWFQSLVQIKPVVMARNAAFLVLAAVKGWLIFVSAPMIAFAWAGTAEVLVAAAGVIGAFYLKGERLGRWRIDGQTAVQLLRDSWPLIFSGVVVMIFMRIDQVMIASMIGDEAVGHYAAALRISEFWYFLPLSLTTSVFPYMVRPLESGGNLSQEGVQTLYDVVATLSIAIALTISLLSPWLVTFLYGDRYAAAATALSIHVWTGVFAVLGVVKGYQMVTKNIQWYSLVYTSCGAAFNIVANLFLIPAYGIAGAAIATTIAQVLSVVAVPLLYRQDRIDALRILRSLTGFRRLLRIS